MKRKLKLILSLFIAIQAFATTKYLQLLPTVLAPNSHFKTFHNEIELFCRFVHHRLPATPSNLTLRLTEPEFFLEAPDTDTFALDPESVFVLREATLSGSETHISFRYYNPITREGFLVKARVKPDLHVDWKKFPLQEFSSIKERVTYTFTSPTNITEEQHDGRIGDHRLILQDLLSDPDFMSQTIWKIYVCKPYETLAFSERPISLYEIAFIEVSEDERGSQKQIYRVVVKLVDGIELAAFALKIGISSNNLGCFREGEIDHLKNLQSTGAVPILGAFKKVPAYQVDASQLALFRKKGRKDDPITVEAYSEEFIEGATLVQALKLKRVFCVKEVPYATYSHRAEQLNLFLRPGGFIHTPEGETQARYYLYDDIEEVLDLEQMKKAIQAWVKITRQLSQKNKKEGRITCVVDMQPKNLMYRMQRGKPFPQKNQELYSQIAIVGNPVIIDLGQVESRKPSTFLMLLTEYYYSFLSTRGPPTYNPENVQQLISEESLKRGEEILKAILESFLRPQEGLEMLNEVYQELRSTHSRKGFSLRELQTTSVLKNVFRNSKDQKEHFWKEILFELLDRFKPLQQYRLQQSASQDALDTEKDPSLNSSL